MSKVNKATAAAMQLARAQGAKFKDIAARFGVSLATAYCYAHEKNHALAVRALVGKLPPREDAAPTLFDVADRRALDKPPHLMTRADWIAQAEINAREGSPA